MTAVLLTNTRWAFLCAALAVMPGVVVAAHRWRGPDMPNASQIKPDERVVFFPTAGRHSEDGSAWIVPVHGWIFEPEESDVVRAAAMARLRRALRLDPEAPSTAIFEERAGWFLVDNERGKRVAIRVGERAYALERSGRNGHFTGTFTIPAETAAELAPDGRLTFRAVTEPGDDRAFRGVAYLVEPVGLSVISDIDDTIKISEVTDKRKLIANTFFEPFRPVAGVAQAYRRWAEEGATFHYVSSSPWQLYEPLAEFLRDAGFPEGTFHLKAFRFKDTRLLALWADPVKYKSKVITSIFEAYPRRQFILVGDSGEKDPEVYGLTARRYPERVKHIYLRNVTAEPADAPRYREAFKDVPNEKWQLFVDPGELTPPKREPRASDE